MVTSLRLVLRLLRQFSWRELTHHPWRNAAAVVAVMLGVALAFSTHLINASALSEFSQAVRAVNGQPDLELRAVQGSFDESIYAKVAAHPKVLLASPVLEVGAYALSGGQRVPLRVVGVDALSVAGIAPALMPVPDTAGSDDTRFALFAPNSVFLNAAARQQLSSSTLQLQSGLALQTVRVAGRVSTPGAALAVMDIGAAQDLFGKAGQLSRIDVKLQPGTDAKRLALELALPGNITLTAPGDDAQRVSNLSRAYRVNLTVLALVALFTGAFLVFSVLSLSVAKRAQQLALLGVLGLTGRERLGLVLAESLLLGLVGSALGLALGTGLAALALRLLGGDLGGGYFAGVAPSLQFDGSAALLYGALGMAAAGVGGWWPARDAQRLPPAQTLKGLGAAQVGRKSHRVSLALIAAGVVAATAPPVFGIPLAAYLSVALLLVGGITALPWGVSLLYDRLAPLVAHRLLPLLAVERARRVRESAAVAVSGVVASLSLAVALTVMVASFRESVTQWLDVVLPADLYVRTALGTSAADTAYFSPGFVAAVGTLPGVARVASLRTTQVLLDANQPAIALIARPLDDPAQALPLVGNPLPVPPGQIGIYVSEAMVDLYGARPGTVFKPLSKAFGAVANGNTTQTATETIANQTPAIFFVAGVWRDYARQFGSIAIAQRDFERLSGDQRVNDLAVWLQSAASEANVQNAIRTLAEQQSGAAGLLELASVRQIRATSLTIFDRSFAVTYWLQGVAIAIGLFGVAASFSAQVLARRKEFGLLAHLGLTRRQILTVVAGEGAAWTVIGAIAGVALGLAVSVVLVHVVNPQSFHWTMDLRVPWLRLAALCGAVVVAGTVTAWLAGRAAAGRDAVLAVKEDW
ncbi:MAG: ABC transporter permease [Polaromonas sp.]|nr:ABC transporter permease [Polaromonas sp.]